jgi:hypothetical protein
LIPSLYRMSPLRSPIAEKKVHIMKPHEATGSPEVEPEDRRVGW